MIEREPALQRLRDAGLRLTPQRRAVISALAGNRSHPSAEQISATVAAEVPGVSLSTVYNTLHELAALGLVRQLDLPGSMRFDPDVSHHAHLVCEGCGTVVDIGLGDDFARALSLPAGVELTGVDVTLTGRCATCTSGPGYPV